MLSEFERLLEILSRPVIELLREQESDEYSNKSLDFVAFPRIHCVPVAILNFYHVIRKLKKELPNIQKCMLLIGLTDLSGKLSN